MKGKTTWEDSDSFWAVTFIITTYFPWFAIRKENGPLYTWMCCLVFISEACYYLPGVWSDVSSLQWGRWRSFSLACWVLSVTQKQLFLPEIFYTLSILTILIVLGLSFYYWQIQLFTFHINHSDSNPLIYDSWPLVRPIFVIPGCL
jgi:hypothetical protein